MHHTIDLAGLLARSETGRSSNTGPTAIDEGLKRLAAKRLTDVDRARICGHRREAARSPRRSRHT
jgi:hypothetical protein